MSKSKIKSILFEVYWRGYSDGGLAEFDELSMRQQHTAERIAKRKAIIEEALQKLNLPNTACSRRVPRRGANVVKSKSKVRVGRTRG